jgi:hypothetical protein
MNSKIKSCLVLSVGVASSLRAGGPSSKITVLVFNYAAIRFEMLAQAETEVARIYHPGNIEIQWLDCPLSPKEAAQFPACQVPMGPTKLVLRILSQSMAERLRQAKDSYGSALTAEDGSFAIIANVFADQTEQLANHHGIRCGVMLGDVAAHEIGHLLLGSRSHSNRGIMQARWRQKELEMTAQGLMAFTHAELKKLRTNVSVRTAQEAAIREPVLIGGGAGNMQGLLNSARVSGARLSPK